MKTPLYKLLSAFTIAAATSGYGCAANNNLRTHRMVEPSLKAEHGYWSIFVVTDSLVNVPILPNPAHNFVRIYDPAEDTVFLDLHGAPIDRAAYDMVNIGDRSHALLAIVHGDGIYNYQKDPIVSTEVFYGTQEEVMRKAMIALDAMACINDQNLPYDMFEFFGDAQNSNSVAYSLVSAMGLSFPRQNLREMVPGHGRMLLPENWQSIYESWVFPSNDPEFISWYIGEMRTQLSDRSRAVCNTGTPERQRTFFNPHKPFATYTPLIIDDALSRWQAIQRSTSELKQAEEQALYSAPEAGV